MRGLGGDLWRYRNESPRVCLWKKSSDCEYETLTLICSLFPYSFIFHVPTQEHPPLPPLWPLYLPNPTPPLNASTNSMTIPHLPPLHPKKMAIWHRRLSLRPIQPRKTHKNIHRSHLLINHIPSIRHLDPPRHNMDTILPLLRPPSRQSPLQPIARLSMPRYIPPPHIPKPIKIPIPQLLYLFPRFPRRQRNNIPLLPFIQIQRPSRVKKPVPLVCNHRFNQAYSRDR